jgi:hypothetical protein
MGHDALRHDTECQNCGHTVAQKYCPNCGQKNTETRQPFTHLVGHFVEDLTHYDSGFWKTLKYLLFRPGFLTTEYLIGKRQLYVPPVKLYIFISFIAFLLPALIPDTENENVSDNAGNTTLNLDSPFHVKAKQQEDESDFFRWLPSYNKPERKKGRLISPQQYASLSQLDSLEALKPDSLKMNFIQYKAAKKLITLYEHNSEEEVFEKFCEAAPHNIPKMLFIYMPLFAFWIWLFHGKKRWYFFDHSIFTLHYFSFLLLTNAFLICLFKITVLLASHVLGIICLFMMVTVLLWQIYYFYRSHRKMYSEKWFINFIKSTTLFLINIILMLILFVCLCLYTYYNLH